jgi:predicted  nucleic acid-binding Zn-ribbon protein
MQELETLERELETLERETPDERAAREQAEAAWEERRREAGGELQDIERRIREVSARLGAASFERFKRLWNSRRPSAVVPLDGTSCSACHAELRPSLVQQVRTAEELQYCDTCRRMLYDPETIFPLA